MIKVYQTIFGTYDHPPPGNCMQAVWASLLELKLGEVPHFISKEQLDKHGGWFKGYCEFLRIKGYEYMESMHNPRMLTHSGVDRFELLQSMKGINGYFEASVLSPGYFDISRWHEKDYVSPTHSVIIDQDMNVVHDPNPK